MRRKFPALTVAITGLFAGLFLYASPAMARDYSAGPLLVAHPWAPPTLGKQKIGVAYFTVRNPGAEDDRLLGVDLPDGGTAQLHNSQIENDVMRMRPIDGAVIAAGGELTLKPGAMHVMLSDLPGPLIEGGLLKLKLHFEKAGPIEVAAMIEKRSVTPSSPSPHSGH